MSVTGRVIERGDKFKLVLDYGYTGPLNPTTGKPRRKLRQLPFEPEAGSNKKDARQQAKAALAKLQTDEAGGVRVAPSKLTLTEWMLKWVEAEEAGWRPSTRTLYKSIIENHVAGSPLGSMKLTDVRGSDVKKYLASLTEASASTLTVHYAVIRGALRLAKDDGHVAINHASDIKRPKREKPSPRERCWTAEEARKVLKAAAAHSVQASAFFTLALDTGGRSGELLGLAWEHVDFENATVTFKRTILSERGEPRFGPTKTGVERTVHVDVDTLARLKAHKVAQATVKMKNRQSYNDLGLVFAREPLDLTTSKLRLGDPMTSALDLTIRLRVVKDAGVRDVTMHGTRHTVATLMLNAGVPVHEVAARLGHASVVQTLNTYAHALPQKHVAGSRSVMGAVLNG